MYTRKQLTRKSRKALLEIARQVRAKNPGISISKEKLPWIEAILKAQGLASCQLEIEL